MTLHTRDRAGVPQTLLADKYYRVGISTPWLWGRLMRIGVLVVDQGNAKRKWLLTNVQGLWSDLQGRGARPVSYRMWDALPVLALLAVVAGLLVA